MIDIFVRQCVIFPLDKPLQKVKYITMSEKTDCLQKQRVKTYVNSNSLSPSIEESYQIYILFPCTFFQGIDTSARKHHIPFFPSLEERL